MKVNLKKIMVTTIAVATLCASALSTSAASGTYSFSDYSEKTLGSQYMGTGTYTAYVATGAMSTTSGTPKVQFIQEHGGYVAFTKTLGAYELFRTPYTINSAQTVKYKVKKASAGTVSADLTWLFNC